MRKCKDGRKTLKNAFLFFLRNNHSKNEGVNRSNNILCNIDKILFSSHWQLLVIYKTGTLFTISKLLFFEKKFHVYSEVQKNTDTTSRAQFSPRTIPFSARKERELRKIFVFTCAVVRSIFPFFNWSLRKKTDRGNKGPDVWPYRGARAYSKRLMPKDCARPSVRHLNRENHLYII